MKHLLASRCITLGLSALFAVLEGCGVSQPPLSVEATPQNPAAAPTSSIASFGLAPKHFKVLHYFSGGQDGANPFASLVNWKGVLYGTTEEGGGSGCYGSGCGTVYSISTSGVEKVLYSFDGGSDGMYPNADLVNINGILYGTTHYGGVGKCILQQMHGILYGCGTVYSVTKTGEEKVIYNFAGGKDGEYPSSGLIDVNGTLYGTTDLGDGTGCYDGRGCGTVYRVSTSGKEKVLFAFGTYADGRNPRGGLLDVKNTLYGTANYGGAFGKGTVYRISITGANFAVLHSFKDNPDGGGPTANLIDVKGTLYGTTNGGGGSGDAGYGLGTVYKISTDGKEKVIYTFKGGDDGGGAYAGLIDVKGKLYGTTAGGGANCGCGTVYGVTTAGSERVLHHFNNSDGALPFASLVESNGALYGTTPFGGGSGCYPTGCGVVFVLTP